MKIIREADFKTALVASFKRRWPTCFTRKMVQGPWGGGGLPDLFICVPIGDEGKSVSLWIEAKLEGSAPTKLQAETMRQMHAANALVFIVTLAKYGQTAWATRSHTDKGMWLRRGQHSTSWTVEDLLP